MAEIIPALNSFAEQWWPYVFHATWQAALVAAIALLLVSVFRRLPAPWRYAILLIALVKFAVPPILTYPFGLFHWTGAVVIRPAAHPLPRAESGGEGALAPVARPPSPPRPTAMPTEPPESPPHAKPGAANAGPTPSSPLPRPPAPPLTWKSRLLLLHLASTLALLSWITLGLIRLARVTGGAQRIEAHDSRLKTQDLHARLNALSARLGLRDTPDLLITDEGLPPVAFWLLRPKIMIPRSLIDRLPPAELDTILAHELIHHRRNDWAANLFQLLLLAAWWFNPLIWLLNRALVAAREECCDDALLAAGLTQPDAYCRTLLSAAKEMDRPTPLGATLAFADHLHPVSQRIRRIMNPKLKRIGQLSPAALVIVALLAVAVLPGLRTRAERPEPVTAKPPADWTDIVTVTVVDEESGEPIPKAEVVAQIGKPESRFPYETDDRGVAEVRYDAKEHHWFQIIVSAPNHVRMTSQHNDSAARRTLPRALEYKLPVASQVGGVVHDSDDQAIRGATVGINLPYGISLPSPIPHKSITDDQGRWAIDVPAKLDAFDILATHPDFAPFDHQARGSFPTEKQLRDQTAVLVLHQGATIEGMVTDDQGNPIENAYVYFGPLLYLGKETRTDKEGKYKLTQLKPQTTMLTAAAPGRSPHMRSVTATNGVLREDFRLGPGHTIRGKVVDRGGQPIQDVDVWLGHWGPYQTIQWKSKTDADGRFEWRDAPTDPVNFDFFRTGYLTRREQSLQPGDETHIITLTPTFRVTGSVTDAGTGEPIDKFTVTPGTGSPNSDKIVWADFDAGHQSGGRYEIPFDESKPLHFVRIEAQGYAPVVSRAFDEADGDAEYDLRLHAHPNITGLVLLTNGQPAADAKVMLYRTGDMAAFTSGDPNIMLDAVPHHITEKDGLFAFPPQESGWRIAVFHETGYGEIDETAFRERSEIQLRPWARIEGELRNGSRAGKSEEIYLWENTFDPNRWHYPRSHDTHTDGSGRFAFGWVRPGPIGLGRKINYSNGHTVLEQRGHLIAKPGQTIRVTLGGTGRPLTGRVEMPQGMEVGESFGRHEMVLTTVDQGLRALAPNQWDDLDFRTRHKNWAQWLLTDAGKAYDAERQRLMLEHGGVYVFELESDGSFRVEDVPAGEYNIHIRLYEKNKGLAYVGRADRHFTVPEMPGGRSDEPLDLGAIPLTPAAPAPQ